MYRYSTLLGLFVAGLVLAAAYAALGYGYTWLLVRDRLPPVRGGGGRGNHGGVHFNRHPTI